MAHMTRGLAVDGQWTVDFIFAFQEWRHVTLLVLMTCLAAHFLVRISWPEVAGLSECLLHTLH